MYNYDDDAPTNQYPPEHLPEFFGYIPLAATDDGDMLCYWCVADPTNPVHVSTGDEPHPDGWGITSWFCDGDIDTVEYCAHCNRQFGPESTTGMDNMTSMNEWMIANGYLAAKETRDGRWAAVAPMLFTHRIIIGPKGSPFVDDAWCYHDAPSALTAFHEWDPDTEPEPQGWHRHPRTGRRRVHGDPATEYVAR